MLHELVAMERKSFRIASDSRGLALGVWRGTTCGPGTVGSLIPPRSQRVLGGDQLAHVHDVVTGALHGGPDVGEAIRAQERDGLRHRLGRPPAPHHEREAGEAGAQLLAQIPHVGHSPWHHGAETE
jgi:hypothetical protein